MPANYLNFPFDPELFLLQWKSWPDPIKTALLTSGVMSANGTLRSLIANGSDVFTLPFYDTIGGVPDNYDGATDITVEEVSGSHQSGVVYGRAKAWRARDFVFDFNSGADPMRQITSQVSRYWEKQRQALLLGILRGIFGITGTDTKDTEWALHNTDISASGGTVADTNKLGPTTAGDAAVKACGDNASIFSMAIMHSVVANNLAGKQLLEFRKYTDASGIERSLNIADFNGLTVVVDDATATADGKYETYLLGSGAIQYAPAPVHVPVEVGRERLKDGGYDHYITRIREAMHPNGFTFTVPASGYTHSPTNAQLGDSANWKVVGVPKAIPMARIISNG